jgi:L-amino acid N-acyltransferase YncA
MTCPTVRPATPRDIPAITAIYAHYVATSVATFELTAPTEAEMLERFVRLANTGYPYLVTEDGGKVAGYAYAGPYRPRPAYRFTVEDTIYLAPEAAGRGLGTQLLGELIAQCQSQGHKQMIAIIGGATESSQRLHARLGFHEAGRLANVGYKFDRWLDTLLMQRAL